MIICRPRQYVSAAAAKQITPPHFARVVPLPCASVCHRHTLRKNGDDSYSVQSEEAIIISIENRLINGSFETGAFPPWFGTNAAVTGLQSHSGYYAAQLAGGAANAFIYQFVPVAAGERFEFVVSLSGLDSSVGAPLTLSVIFYGPGLAFLEYGLIVHIPAGRTPAVGNDTWLEIYQTTSEAPPDATQALIVINKLPQPGSPAVLVDDVSLLAAAAASGDNNIADYAYIYHTGNEEVQPEADIAFNANGALAGIFHPVGTGRITIGSPGVYAVSFVVVGGEPNQFALFQNGSVVPGSLYGIEGSGQSNTGTVMIAAQAGDVLTVRNHTSTTGVNLLSAAGGSQTGNVNASIQIVKLRSPWPVSPALEAVNEAETTGHMRAAIENPELGLQLAEYETLSEEGKNEAAAFLLSNRPALGYSTANSVQAGLDYAVEHVVDPLNIYVRAGAADGDGSRARPLGTIEEGIATVAEGGTVHVLAGTYPIDTQLVVAKSATLRGEANPLPQVAFNAANTMSALVIQADEVAVEQLHIVCNRALTADNAIIQVPLRATDNLYRDIRFDSNIVEGTIRSGYIWAENLTVTDNTFVHNAENTQSLRLQMLRGETNVMNNTFQGNAASEGAIVIEPNLASYSVSGTIRIVGNTMIRFTQFVNFYTFLGSATSLYMEDNDIDHEDRSGSSIILTTRVNYSLMENLLIQNNTFVNAFPIRLAVYFAGGGGGSNIPAEDQIQVYSNTFDFPNGYGERPGDVSDPEFPVGYNADAASFGMTLAAFDLQNNVNV